MSAVKKSFTCICCPVGCQLEVTLKDAGGAPTVVDVTGYTCRRGKEYAQWEATHPVRMLTMAVPVKGRLCPVSAKTATAIPKESMASALEEVHGLRLQPPVHAGDVLMDDIAGTGVPLVATKTVL